MDSLRLTLVIVGLIIVAGVYLRFRSKDDHLLHRLKALFSRRAAMSSASATEADDELIPVLTPIDDEPDMQDFETLSQVIHGRDKIEALTRQDDISFSAVDAAAEQGPASMLVILNIMSPAGHVFTGEGIHAVMISAGLQHGEHQIYHYMQQGQAVFSIANAIEPGYFDPDKLAELTTPGLALFMQLPGPLECRKAFDTLLEISERLATALGGELCDENRSVLTSQTIAHLKEKLDMYRLQQQAAMRQKHH